MQKLRDNFFSEYEINNHNLLVMEGGRDFALINQILPLQYEMEFSAFLSQIYEEEAH